MMVHWLLPLEALRQDSIRKSNLASIRLRAGAFADACNTKNINVYFGEDSHKEAEILVIGKIGGGLNQQRISRWSNVIAKMKAQGGKVVVDYTDHHLTAAHTMGDFYRSLLVSADVFVVPSEKMRRNLMTIWSGEIIRIPDAIEVEIRSPRSASGSTPSLIWFGHNSNLSYLERWLASIPLSAPATNLNLVTDNFGIERLTRSGISMPRSWNATVFPWSLSNLYALAQLSDLCVIPSDPEDHRKNGAGSNRLLTALALGLPVAADLLPSYSEFKQYFTDIRSINWDEAVPREIFDPKIVLNAQENVLPSYSMSSIGQKWIHFFNELNKHCIPI